MVEIEKYLSKHLGEEDLEYYLKTVQIEIQENNKSEEDLLKELKKIFN